MASISHVLMVEDAAARLAALAAASSPYETGGLLLGVLGDQTPWVTQVVEVPSNHPRLERYELPPGVTQALVREARESDPRVGYIGDWHSHPADAGASSRDLTSLTKLALAAIRRREPRPLLVVVQLSREGWILKAHQGRWPRERRLEVVLTGPPA